jgi:Ca2+-transporting ATPase
MATGTLILFAIETKNHGDEYARTMAFFTLAGFQLFHVLAIRRERQSAFKTKLNTNPFLAMAVIGTFVLQIVITYVAPIGKIFKTVPISLADMALCTIIACSVFFAVELEKAFYRKRSVSH